ncbi:MAG: hypothetical protein ACYDAE_26485 [Steroidobacteraceae bacterium]
MAVPQLDAHQLVGVLLFIGALIASVVFPYWCARGVVAFKRFVYRRFSEGDLLLVFDLLLFATAGQLVVVVAQGFHDAYAYRGHPFDVGQTWSRAIWPDHELRWRTGIFLVLVTLPFAVAYRLRHLHDHDNNQPNSNAARRWNRAGRVVLGAVLLANLFLPWTLGILGL